MPDARMAREQLHEARSLGGVHARHRLVQQQHRRLRRKRERDAEQALIAVRQRAGDLGARRSMPTSASMSRPRPRARPRTALARKRRSVSPERRAAARGAARSGCSRTRCCPGTRWCAGRCARGRGCDLVRLQAVQRRAAVTNLPSVGRRKPVMTLKAVVLPAPFGPIRPTTSPSYTVKLMSAMAMRPPKCTASARRERRLGGSPASWRGPHRVRRVASPGRRPRATAARWPARCLAAGRRRSTIMNMP